MGVAPLLFVQTLYDPFWYTSNALSAAWAMGFVAALMAGYSLLYVFAGKGEGAGATAAGAAAVLLFLAAGSIMHALNVQLLAPEKWLAWSMKAGAPDVSGLSLHAFEPARFSHFILPAFAVTGVFLMLYAWYLAPRADADKAFLDWTARLGAALAFRVTAAQVLAGGLWLMTLPREFRYYADPPFEGAVALGLALFAYLGWLDWRCPRPAEHALPAGGATLAAVLAMAANRETLRGLYLGRHGFAAAARAVKLDPGSTALFFVTFALGASVAAWLLAVAFKSGRVAGRWEAGPRMRAWGSASLGLLAAWLVAVAALGLFITLRNGGA
jgi:hypothetical protein